MRASWPRLAATLVAYGRTSLLGGSTLLDRGPVLVLLVTESNRLHGSNSNTSRYPRSNLFVVYNSVENPLAPPFAASEPPPTFIADRDPIVV